MNIWRAIFLDSINDLDKSNFGCHWTKDESYPFDTNFFYKDISENGRKGKNLFVFQTKINKNQIDKKATFRSNKKYSSESECVLKTNSFLLTVILISPTKNMNSFEANTGKRCDSWVFN